MKVEDIPKKHGVLEGQFLRKEEAMNHWMCSECNYVFKAETPPETQQGGQQWLYEK